MHVSTLQATHMDSPSEQKEIYTVYEDVEEDPDISLQYKIESFRKYENGLSDSTGSLEPDERR